MRETHEQNRLTTLFEQERLKKDTEKASITYSPEMFPTLQRILAKESIEAGEFSRNHKLKGFQ